ncbi:unnamed protein product [Diamesa serratosioi]
MLSLAFIFRSWIEKIVTAGTVGKIILNFFASILKFIEELNKRANIHGLQHAVNTKLHPLERLVWLAFVAVACYGVYSIGQKQLDRYDANPTVISLERDYRDWNGTLPALTYCYYQRIDNVRAQYLIKRLWNIESFDEEFIYFMDYITTVVNSSIESFISFNRFANDKRFEFLDMLTVAREVHPTISSVVSGFNPNLNTPLVEIITEKGICYSLNAILSATILTKNKQLQQIADPITCSFKKTQCFLKLEVFDPTVFFVVHSPFEVVTSYTQFIHMGLTDEIENTYDIVETTASLSLRPLSIIQRKCLFYDESNANLQVYNVNVCHLTCRAQAAIQLCGCKPYYYPFIMVKYRVSNKFFNAPTNNENTKQNSNALYNLLSQIHYGGISQPNVIPIDTNKIQTEDISPMNVRDNNIDGSLKVPDVITIVTPEASNDMNNEQQLQSVNMKIDDTLATTIIEKVVNEEIKQLATVQKSHESESPIVKVEVIKQHPKLPDNFDKILMVDLKTGERVWINSPFELQFLRGLVSIEQYEALKKTNELLSTESPVISLDVKTKENEVKNKFNNNKPISIKEEEDLILTENPIDKKVSNNLLTAVEDLLSSILDVNVNLKNVLKDNKIDTSHKKVLIGESVDFLEVEQGTEKSDTVTPVDYEGEEKSAEIIDVTTAVSKVKKTTKSNEKSEIDFKIENLSTEQTNIMTENSPEVFTEKFVEIPVTLRTDEKHKVNLNSKPLVLEVITEQSSENEKTILSFENSISQVMALVKGTESRLALQNTTGVLEKIVSNEKTKYNLSQIDQIEDGFSKDIKSNHDSELKMQQNPEREALLKQIEEEIMESMKESNDHDYEMYISNIAKSAMQKFQMDEDF